MTSALDNLNHVESDLARAEETVRALRDAITHVSAARVALRDLPTGSWATLASQSIDLSAGVLEVSRRTAVKDKMARQRAVVAAHDALRAQR